MPLTNLLKSIIGNNVKAKTSDSGQFVARPARGSWTPSMSSSNGPRLPPPQHKPKSLSQINGLHSHRNLKISHQLQLAESMYELSLSHSLDSRLAYNFDQCISDDNSLLYFLQYIESTEKSAKSTITCFLQANCLMVFLKQNFPFLKFELLDPFQAVALDEKQEETFALFIDDFMRLYDYFSLLNCDNQCFQIDGDLQDGLNLFFDCFKKDNMQVKNYGHPLRLFYIFWQNFYGQIESKYYEPFLRSNFYLKYEIDILKSDHLELSDIVHASTAIASTFIDFMDSEDMKNFVDFLIMHKNYKLYSGQHSDALALYDRFFNNSAKSSNTFLDFSESTLRELQTAVRKEPFMPDCFDKIAFILIQYFSKTYLPQFLQSDSFIEYVKSCQDRLRTEKMSTKAKSNSNEIRKLSKRDSDASSHSTHSTDLVDSESLWKRNLKGQLQFTYIDNYGRMSSLFEPEPTRGGEPNSSGGKLTQVIKRFTSNSTEEKKKEEDDAWRIAESIINDVCSVTIDHSTTTVHPAPHSNG